MSKVWSYETIHPTIKDYLEQMLTHLVTDTSIAMPHFGIGKLGRAYLCKYFPTYTNDGTLGYIILNSMYIKPTASKNELIYYIMLAVDALCQHVVTCKNEDKKIQPHCSRVKTMLKKAGLVYHGTKEPLSFTKDENGKNEGLLYSVLEQDFEDDIDQISYPEIIPPPKRTQNEQKPAENGQMTMETDWKHEYDLLQQERDNLQETVQKLTVKLEQYEHKQTDEATNVQQPIEQNNPILVKQE